MLRFGRGFSPCLSLPGSNAHGTSPTGCQQQLYQVVTPENVPRHNQYTLGVGDKGRESKVAPG